MKMQLIDSLSENPVFLMAKIAERESDFVSVMARKGDVPIQILYSYIREGYKKVFIQTLKGKFEAELVKLLAVYPNEVISLIDCSAKEETVLLKKALQVGRLTPELLAVAGYIISKLPAKDFSAIVDRCSSKDELMVVIVRISLNRSVAKNKTRNKLISILTDEQGIVLEKAGKEFILHHGEDREFLTKYFLKLTRTYFEIDKFLARQVLEVISKTLKKTKQYIIQRYVDRYSDYIFV